MIKHISWIIFGLFVMFLSNPPSISAQVCGTNCGWTGTGAGSSCVSYESPNCGGTPGNCWCTFVVGCSSVGPWPAVCTSSHTNILPAPGVCCGGAATSTPAPTGGPGPGPGCGDGICNGAAGETCGSCPTDCGGCIPPACTMSVSPNPISIEVGEEVTLNANTMVSNNVNLMHIRWDSAAPGTAVATPDFQNIWTGTNNQPGLVYSYSTTVRGIAPGTTTITASHTTAPYSDIGDETFGQCPQNVSVLVRNLPAWMQINDGALISRGTVINPLPTGSYMMNQQDSDESVVTYSPSINVGDGDISLSGWNANTSNIAPQKDYSELEEQIPSYASISSIGVENVTNATLSSATVDPQGYEWFRRDGNMTISGNVNIASGRKVIVFVNGNLTINSNVHLANPDTSFLMFVVAGDITVGPTVGGPSNNTTSHLEGVYMTNNRFITQSSNNRLNVHGSVIALSGLQLQRNAQDASNPSESFTFAPEMIVNFPDSMGIKRAFWKEVAP